MATLTAHSAELTALLKSKPERHSTGVEVGINIGFIVLTTFSHCLGVKVYSLSPLSYLRNCLTDGMVALWQNRKSE
jgi:hypothetical protein